MLFGAIGDIHGNLPALRAVLAALDAQGIQAIVDTGDIAVGCPWPNETADTLRERGILSVQGATDRLAVRFGRKTGALRRRLEEGDFQALERTYGLLRNDTLEYLRTLPKNRTISLDGVDFFLCHGTPATPARSLDEQDGIGLFRRARERANTPLVICGRSHRPFARTVEGTLFVNPGSVGAPLSPPHPGAGAQAMYAVIDTEEQPWSASLHQAAYVWDQGGEAPGPLPPLMFGSWASEQ